MAMIGWAAGKCRVFAGADDPEPLPLLQNTNQPDFQFMIATTESPNEELKTAKDLPPNLRGLYDKAVAAVR